ncbi:hypothetical protein GCM10009789_53950 [Kribbella sancticallisti]|uniref:Uncharacterized protein n=1 Tax=Kribbella sancticallisti TaxID=460087 RepID=A0ABP4PWG1_9ACTN
MFIPSSAVVDAVTSTARSALPDAPIVPNEQSNRLAHRSHALRGSIARLLSAAAVRIDPCPAAKAVDC